MIVHLDFSRITERKCECVEMQSVTLNVG